MPRPRLFAALLPVLLAGILIAGRGDAIGAVAALVSGAIALVVAARQPSAPVPSPVDAPLPPPPPASEPPSPQQALDAVDAVLDALAEPVLVVERGRVLVANEAALALLGRHVVGQDVRLAIRHPEAAAVLGPDESSRSGEPILLDGLGALDQLWAMRLLATVDGRHVIHLSDRSAGRAADRMRTDFVANASHELRTPLASILGYVETLQGEAGEEAPLRARFLGVVQGEAARMQRLVQDLLSLSRIEADRFRLPAQRIDLDALVAQVAREFAGAGHAAELRVEVDAPLPPVIGDAPQLLQLLHNLIGNALAYGRPGAAVTLSGGREEGGVRLSVADQGEGIAAEHLPRLTERFYRVDGARSRAAAGTGLGLAIVKHIVERHRGRLSIDSVVGTGTTVTVRLPVAGPTVTEA